MSALVGNPENRFSHNEAHFMCQVLEKKGVASFGENKSPDWSNLA